MGLYGDFGMYGMGMGSGMGMGGGWEGASGEGLFKAFVEPFTDVLKTAVGETKQLMRRGSTLLQVAFETVVTTLVPFLTDSYDEIFAEEEADLERIKGDYADVYARTDEALKGDAQALAFILAPGPVIAKGALDATPKAAASLLSVVTGGRSDKYFGGGYTEPGGGRSSPSGFFKESSSLAEKKKKPELSAKEFKAGVKKALEDPEVVSAMKQKLGPIRKAIIDAKKKKLTAAMNKAKDVLTAKSADQLGKAIGNKSKVEEAKKKVLASKDGKAMDPKQLDAVFAQLPKTSGPMLVKTFSMPLESERKALKDAGIGDEILKMYDTAISKISSFKVN